MDAVIVTTESRLIELIENAVAKYFKPVEQPKQNYIGYWSDADTFDFKGAAKYMNFSEGHLNRLAANGKIPCSKVFGRLKFNKTELDKWIPTQEKKRYDYSDCESALSKSANRKMKNVNQIKNS